MIEAIINTYSSILLPVATGSAALFLLGVYYLFRSKKSTEEEMTHLDEPHELPIFSQTTEDLRAIAGEDVFSTNLDLARAYLEGGRYQAAKSILETVLQQGNSSQQQEAQNLLSLI
jgi:FimV-like protein